MSYFLLFSFRLLRFSRRTDTHQQRGFARFGKMNASRFNCRINLPGTDIGDLRNVFGFAILTSRPQASHQCSTIVCDRRIVRITLSSIVNSMVCVIVSIFILIAAANRPTIYGQVNINRNVF